MKKYMIEKQNIQDASSEIISELNRRIRILETKFDKNWEKISFLEKEVLNLKNDLKVYTNFNQAKFQEIISKIELLEKEIEKIKTSLQEYAKKIELEKLKTIMELFNPLKSNFVTREELEEMLNEFKIKKE
ncbi:MAG: hypothetical protein QXL14_00855 [Candidatus Aenigmatarchaeota archaeon]